MLALLQSLISASATGSTSVSTAAGTRLVLLGGLRALQVRRLRIVFFASPPRLPSFDTMSSQVFKSHAAPSLHPSIDAAMRPLYAFSASVDAPSTATPAQPLQPASVAYTQHTLASATAVAAVTASTVLVAQRQQFGITQPTDAVSSSGAGTSSTTVASHSLQVATGSCLQFSWSLPALAH